MDKEYFIQKLKKNNKKITPQRLAVYELISSEMDHPTAEEIHYKLSKKFPSISLSTVYQILHLLHDLGEITELKLSDKGTRFELNTSLHVNLICPKCEKIKDYHSKNLELFWSNLKQEFDFKPVNQRIDVYRYCDDCKKKIKN